MEFSAVFYLSCGNKNELVNNRCTLCEHSIVMNKNSNNYYYYIDAGIRLGYNTSKEKDGRNQNE